jgi:predicted ArsR family transcriptional regulator
MAGLLSRDAGPPLGQRRAEVLDMLRAVGSPVGVREVADRMGLHPNTARFHLDALVDAGLAVRAPRARTAPGRPSTGYQATGSGGIAGRRQYRLLAEMLTSLISGVLPRPGEAAAEAGREWGRYLTDQPAPYQRVDTDRAMQRLTGILEEIGFAPEAVADGARHQILLRHCPFREVAANHQDVVCELHFGLIQGVLDQMRAPVTVERLQPFAEPALCIAYLTAQHDSARDGGNPTSR